jgi:ATP/maltotriose-dependent transcriptional regulator MalT
MLVGREVETESIDHLLDGARGGRSGTLVLNGEPGIGKSALCAYAVERATDMTVLRARGAEWETELPFAALADLLHPVLGYIDEIPAPQAAALNAALALGPPAGGDRFTTCAATLSVLAAAAERSPLLAVVDDVHWLDRSSAQALLFATRRLDAEGVAFLFALRESGGTLFDAEGLPELKLGGLGDDAAARVLDRAGRAAIVPEVARRLIAACAGNPLALLEVPSLLTPGQLAGVDPLDDPLPASEGLDKAFLRRVERLPDETQRALLIAAASGSTDFEEISAALERAGLAREALDPAEQAGLTTVTGPSFEFRHPLLRAAVYHSAPAAMRRAAHEAAAAGIGGERRAWHLAAASPAPDSTVAAELEGAAVAARERGGHAEAAAGLEGAARLAREPAERARLLRDAAAEARRAGESARALELLGEALGAATQPELIARIQHLRGVIEMWSGSARAAAERLTAEARRLEASDPARAAWLLSDGGWAWFMAGEVTAGRDAAERAFALAEGTGGFAEILATAVLGIALLLNGDRGRAEPLLRRHQPLLDDPDFLGRTYSAVWPAAQALVWLEEHEQAHAVFTRVIERARSQSVLSLLPYTLTGLAELDFRTGAWARAYANASEAVGLAKETEQPAALAFALAGLARIEAAQGREDDCRAHVTHALDLADLGVGAVVIFSAAALGLLELGLGRSERAIEQLGRVASEARAHGLVEPTVVQWGPDLIEAYARSGKGDEATAALALFELEAEASASRWALAAVARCRGLLASDADFESDFARALELHETIASPFERARTELCLGERLRRARRRKEARTALRSALERFERLGAAPWTERAGSELRASGETLRRREASASDELTPQELQVALLVARGATNREAGAALFLSPKTIEAHLGRAYRKLNVRSRTELAALLARDDVLASP